jgi:hypothetical protein
MPTQIKLEPIVPQHRNFPENLYAQLEANLAVAMQGPVRQKIESALYSRAVGWAHRITFKSTYSTRVSALGLTGVSLLTVPFGTNKRFWIYVSAGVKAHPIYPRKKNLLRIRGGVGGYASHTKPGGVAGGRGAYNDDATFYSKFIRNWPGIEPREFEKWVVAQNAAAIVSILTAAIDRAMR